MSTTDSAIRLSKYFSGLWTTVTATRKEERIVNQRFSIIMCILQIVIWPLSWKALQLLSVLVPKHLNFHGYPPGIICILDLNFIDLWKDFTLIMLSLEFYSSSGVHMMYDVWWCWQAGTELYHAQVKLCDIVEVVVEVTVKALAQVEVQLLFRVGWWRMGGRRKRN